MTTRHLRITGLVKTMNEVRIQWSAGLSPAQTEPFRKRVRETVIQVEKICREHKIKPEQLPTPSYRAYRYLKNLDLNKLPAPAGPGAASLPPFPPAGIRIPRLVAFCAELHEQLFGYTQEKRDRKAPLNVNSAQVAAFSYKIRSMIATVETVCREARLSPLSLPGPSRRTYLWLKFLATPANLDRHLTALGTALEAAQKAPCVQKGLLKASCPQVQIKFASLPALYRARLEKGLLHITANEGYTSAPPAVLEALVCTALTGTSRSAQRRALYLAKIKDYAQSTDFRLIATAVEHGEPAGADQPFRQTAGASPNDPRLETLFRHVNDAYFCGALPMPRLLWNKTITHRKLGHYQDSTDTVMISLTLDHPKVPEFVLEFVLYHELLHKKLGLQIKNGRRYAHTPAFHAEERKFQQYEQARAFLDSLGKKLNL